MKKLPTLIFLSILFYSSARAGCSFGYQILKYHDGIESSIYATLTNFPDTVLIYPGDSVKIRYHESGCAFGRATLYYNGIMIDSSDWMIDGFFNTKSFTDTGEYYFNLLAGPSPPKFYLAYYSNTSIANIASDNVNIYPNPITTNLKVQLSETLKGKITFQIYDVMGREVSAQSQILNLNSQIDISFLQAGVYFLKINAGEKSVVKKFLKE